jgi:hypothetical protein
MRKDRSGVSTMVGMAIILAIFFTTLIPLYVYMSSLYGLLSSEMNYRRIRDVDRETEDLKLLVEGKSGINQGDYGVSVVLKNTSPLLIRVERIWMMNVVTGSPVGDTPCIDRIVDVPPGWNVTVNVDVCTQGFTGRVQFIAITERGRLFGSQPVNLLQGRIMPGIFPYTLTVSIINMRRGSDYTIEVVPLGDADIHPRSVTYKATASNENISLSFGATAGTFSVYLKENGALVRTARLVAPPNNPANVTLPDYWNVVFILRGNTIRPVTMGLEISAPRRVLAGVSFSFDIVLSLPSQADEDVRINYDGIIQAMVIRGDYEPNTLDCSKVKDTLSPGSTETVARCYIIAAEPPQNRTAGSITITVNQIQNCGTGVSSNLPYPSNSDSVNIQVRGQRGR